ncbi:hypothetical protein EF902_31120, partial [Streptomyces sp. WAC05858]
MKRLAEEHDFDQASYSSVRNYVRERRPEIAAEAKEGSRHLEGMVPQAHLPGGEAEVDFADVWVRVAGEAVKCHLFTLRLSCSGKAVHRMFASQAQESFLEGHAEAFRVLGGYVGDDSSAISCSRSGWSLPSRSSDGLAAAVGTKRRCCGK